MPKQFCPLVFVHHCFFEWTCGATSALGCRAVWITHLVLKKTMLQHDCRHLLVLQKLYLAMITRVLRNPTRNCSSEIFWCNARKAIVQIDSWKDATKTENNKIAIAPRKSFPKSYSVHSIATIWHNFLKNYSKITFLVARTMFSEWRAGMLRGSTFRKKHHNN